MDAVPQKIYELMGVIEARDSHVIDHRLRAMSALGDLLLKEPMEAGVLCLLECVRQERNTRLIMQAMSVLSRIKAEDAVPVLIDVLLATHIELYEHPEPADFDKSDESARLRCGAAQALGKIGDNRAIIPLMSILNNRQENYRLRLAVAESLGRMGDEYAVKPLIDILADEREKSVYLKESAVKALGMLGDIRAIEPLIDILESKQGIRDKFNFLKEQIIEAVGRIGQPSRKASDSLRKALNDEAPSIRLAAVEALGQIGDEDCVEALKNCVLDENDEVAKAAVYAVYTLQGEAAIRELLSRENLPRFLREEIEGYIP
ncbi:HEAT repeat domain-containing protein [Vampirovibrio sp.]|uniref:HEAT repeat domain-containing protein n=1 Tax=Vampirovibrio sp. TaxID=2717857 RepID=UPI0035933011